MILTVTPNPSLDRTLEIPAFAAGATSRARLVAVTPAGKGLNVARCLKGLGTDACAVGIVGRRAAQRFAASLAGRDIRHAFVESDCEVRQSTTIVDPGADRETHLREPGGPVAPSELDSLVELVSEWAAGCAWVAVCGSLPEGVDSAGLARVLEAARAAGAKVALDSSGEGLAAARLAKVDLSKPNGEELAQLAGRRIDDATDALEAAGSVSGELGSTLLVTLGAEGALLVGEGEGEGRRLRATCEPEEFVSSVGAGDAALAGYLSAASRLRPPDERLRSAVAAGAASLAETVAGTVSVARYGRLFESARATEL